MSDAHKAAVRKAIEKLRALKPDVPTEKPWTPLQIPGVYVRDGETISDRDAQSDWLDNNDPRQVMKLLRAGLADAESQRVAADIIARAVKGQLPTPNATRAAREDRDYWIARWMHMLLQDGMRPGAAERATAKQFRVSDTLVRSVWARPEMQEDAMLVAAQLAVLAKKHTSN